jgi:hypothetical protein
LPSIRDRCGSFHSPHPTVLLQLGIRDSGLEKPPW